MNPETVVRESKTGDRLFSAAESMFLARGYDRVSVRELTERAGANVAAVNYYFGGKRNLYIEVLRRKLGEITHRKLEALDGVIAENGFTDLRGIVRVYVAEFMESILASPEEQRLLHMMLDEMGRSEDVTELLFEELIYPIHTILKDAVLKMRPELSSEKASLCVTSITGQILHFLKARVVIERTSGRVYDAEFIAEIIEHITDFSLRGAEY